MAEQLICNQQVVGSTPTTSSKRGKIPEWPKGADCKSVGTAFGGSNPPLPTKKKTSQCGVFFYAGNRGFCAVYTARRITPRTTFRCWRSTYASKLARFAIKRIHLFPPKKKASKFRCFLFLCEREWMRYRVSKPRFAPLRIATAPLRTLLNIALHNAAFCCIFENCPTPRLSTSFEKLRCLFLCWESWILRGFHRAARCAWTTCFGADRKMR